MTSAVAATHELKSLETRLTSANAELKAAEDLIATGREAAQRARGKIESLRTQIAELKAKSSVPVVTEHALLRYIERVYKINLDEIRSEILNPKTLLLIEQFGSGKIPSEGCRLIVKNRTVVTIEAKD